MADYIKREDVLAKKQTIYFEYFDSDSGYVEEEGDLAVTVEDILKIPAANVRPVVLCRDCEHYQADCGWCGLLDIGMNINGFCSRGENGETDGEEARRIKKQLALNGLGYPYDLPNVEES